MADLSEVLMGEHSAIRVITRFDALSRGDFLFDFCDYLDNCHVLVEEMVYFPAITDYDWEDRASFESTVNRIKADHRLIRTLGDNLKKWKLNGDQLFSVRLPLYYKTVTEHNLSEEVSVFPRWNRLSEDVRLRAIRDAKEIITSFGFERYQEQTGISAEFFKYILGSH